MSGDGIMRKGLTVFMVIACVVAAAVMYMYWNRETEVVTHGVLVDNDMDKTARGTVCGTCMCGNPDRVSAA